MEELGVAARARRAERPEPVALLGTEDAIRPPHRSARVAGELAQLERADDGEIVVPGEGDRGALTHEVAALVRARSVADDVAETPDLVDRLAVDVGEHRLKCVKIGMDVRDDRD